MKTFGRWPWTRMLAVAASLAIVSATVLTVRFALSPSAASTSVENQTSAPTLQPTPRISSPAAGGYLIPDTVPNDCSTEASGGIMQWLAGVPRGGVARFQPKGCYLVNDQVDVMNRTGLVIDGNGSTFKRTIFHGPPPGIWRFDGGGNLRLENLTIQGTDPTDSYDPTKKSEHAIAVYGVQGFVASHITATHVWGDCLTDNYDWRTGRLPNEITLQNSTCDSGRQGVSAVTGSGFYLRNNTFLFSKLAQIDLEPDTPSEVLTNVVIDGNHFYHPYGEIGPEIDIAGCLVSNIQITNNRNEGYPTGAAPIYVRPSIGCYSSHNLTVSGNYWMLDNYNAGQAPVDVARWRYVYVKNNTFVANYKYAFGYILSVQDSAHVWYSGNTITGPYAGKWKKVKADDKSSDIHVAA